MHILLLFLDGVGLGAADPEHNPFVTAELPNWRGLINGAPLLADTPAIDSARARFIPTDTCLGVAGPPQSATGQAAILTGVNVPQMIGGHWGPKPNAAIAEIIRRESVFIALQQHGLKAALLNAYPQRYFDAIASGRRIYSAVPLAVTAGGYRLFTTSDLRAGNALSADYTGAGWRHEKNITDAPLYTAQQAGHKMAELAQRYSFSFFEHWLPDYVGHRGGLAEARRTLEHFDAVLGGLLEGWDDAHGLIIITSDHGNMEDLSHQHHTLQRVPTFIIGAQRHAFAPGLSDLTHLAPAIRQMLTA